MLQVLLANLTLSEMFEVLFAIVMRLAWRGLFSIADAAHVRQITQEALDEYGSRAA